MLFLGILLLLIGVGGAIYGNYMNNDFEMRLEYFFETGNTNPGDIFLYAGIVIAIIGLILFIIGLIKHIQNKTQK